MTWRESIKDIYKNQTGMSNRTTAADFLNDGLWYADHLGPTGFPQASFLSVELATYQESTVFIATNLFMSEAFIIVTAHSLITWYVNI